MIARHRGIDDVTQTALRAIEKLTTSQKWICVPSRNRRRHTNGFACHRETDDVTEMDLRAIEKLTTSHKQLCVPSKFRRCPIKAYISHRISNKFHHTLKK